MVNSNVGSFLCSLLEISILLEEYIIPIKGINGILVSASMLLQKCGCESSRESKARNPEDCRLSLEAPRIKLHYSFDQILHPIAQGLQWMVKRFPAFWHFIVVEIIQQLFKFGRNHDETVDTLLQIIQTFGNDAQKCIITGDLLEEHHF